MILRQKFSIVASTNSIYYDDLGGLKSTEAEKKRLLSVSIVISTVADNDIQGYHERAKVFDVPDRLFDVESATGTINLAKPGARINELEVGIEIPVGETFKMAVLTGATGVTIKGTYNYELMK